MGCKKLLAGASAFMAAAVPTIFAAEGDITANTVKMPEGVDIPALINSGVIVLASVVGVALAAWAGWLLVKMCLRYVKLGFRG